MSINLHISFYDQKNRVVHNINIYQTPSKLTKEILGKSLSDIILTKKNINNTFLKPYFLYFNNNLTLQEFNIWWYKEKTEILNYLLDLKLTDDPFFPDDKNDIYYHNQLFPKYFQSKFPPKPPKLFNQITKPDLYDHIIYIKNDFNNYIDDYKCILWGM